MVEDTERSQTEFSRLKIIEKELSHPNAEVTYTEILDTFADPEDGIQSAPDVARKLGVHRSTAYRKLKYMEEELGIVSSYVVGNGNLRVWKVGRPITVSPYTYWIIKQLKREIQNDE